MKPVRPTHHRARGGSWHPGGATAQAVLGPLQPTLPQVTAWLARMVERGKPFAISPELGAFLLRELEHDRREAEVPQEEP